MTEPTTIAGRELLEDQSLERIRDAILAIEQEARTAPDALLREAAEALSDFINTGMGGYDGVTPELTQFKLLDVERMYDLNDALIAALDATPPASAERDAGAEAVIAPECRVYSEHHRCAGCACDCHDRAAEARDE